MATRLNNTVRHQTASNMFQHKYGISEQEIHQYVSDKKDEFSAKWALKIYKLIFSASERRRMNSLPARWLPRTDIIRLIVTIKSECRRSIYLHLPERLRMPTGHCNATLEATDATWWGDVKEELLPEFDVIDNMRRDMWQEFEQAYECLKQFTSIKALSEGWPEVIEFLPPDSAPPTTALMIRPNTINEIFLST